MAIYISTSDSKREYEVLDTIFAFDSHKEGFFTNASPHKAFDGVRKELSEQCKKLGGDAVISCMFEYRNAIGSGLFGKKAVIEIFAYGTAVKFQ